MAKYPISRTAVFVNSIRAPAIVDSITVESSQERSPIIEALRRGYGTARSLHGERGAAAGCRLFLKIDIDGVKRRRNGEVALLQRHISISDRLNLNKFTTGDNQRLAYLRHIGGNVTDNRLARNFIVAHIGNTGSTLHDQRTRIRGLSRNDGSHDGACLIGIGSRIQVVVLLDVEIVGDVNMLATHFFPHSCVQLNRLQIGDIHFLNVHKIEPVQPQCVTRLAGIVGIDAPKLWTGSRYLESIHSRAVASHL